MAQNPCQISVILLISDKFDLQFLLNIPDIIEKRIKIMHFSNFTNLHIFNNSTYNRLIYSKLISNHLLGIPDTQIHFNNLPLPGVAMK